MPAKLDVSWEHAQNIGAKTYTCGYCGKAVASERGWQSAPIKHHPFRAQVYICPLCKQPTYFYGEEQTPGVAYGSEVSHLPNDIADLYREARNSVAVGANTASVLTCRKLLMNIAVAQGAEEGKSFLHYVEFLASQGYVPPNGRGWVDHIRKKGNEANHEIILMSKPDAEELILFTEMLLKFVYEFPNRIPTTPTVSASP
jgi:Domain of unknown function (DUF4145)